MVAISESDLTLSLNALDCLLSTTQLVILLLLGNLGHFSGSNNNESI